MVVFVDNMNIRKYKSIDSWANAMRKDKDKKLWADWFNIGGNWFTCEEYDESGRYMRYTSITAWRHIDIDTRNRYSENWLSDMEATEYPIDDIGLRFDVAYYIDDKLTEKQATEVYNNLYKNKLYENCRELFLLVVNKKGRSYLNERK